MKNEVSDKIKVKKEIKYLISKSLSEFYDCPLYNTPNDAMKSMPKEEDSEKWYCIARLSEEGKSFRYAKIAYYDCINPSGEYQDNMSWYNVLAKNSNTSENKSNISSIKTKRVVR